MIVHRATGNGQKTASPERAARLLLGRVKGVSKVEAETIPVTYVTTCMPSKKSWRSVERSPVYAVEGELHRMFPHAHFDFRVIFSDP